MSTYPFNLQVVHPSWQECLDRALPTLPTEYLQTLHSSNWLPGPEKIFNAFRLPLPQVKYILFGESPYPRAESANGYAFWDAAVQELWSPAGLSKKVNRATSLRNFIKMLLIAEGLTNSAKQEVIATIDKQELVKKNEQLFQNLLSKGFLLLNATPVLQKNAVHKDAKAWTPFMKILLDCILEKQKEIKVILFGRIAEKIHALLPVGFDNTLSSEHPYNISFIYNEKIQEFFQPLHLLRVQTE